MPKPAPKGKPKHVKQPKAARVKNKDPLKKPLSKQEMKFVECFDGNQVKAAKAAGYKHAEKIASGIFNRPHVRAAIEAKEAAFLKKLGQNQARGVKVTRNDIINRLDQESTGAEEASARIMALRELKDIFGLSARHDKDTDFFAGWSIEELDHYGRTGEPPDWVRSGVLPGQGETSGATPVGK
jgi:hypothetical protein